MSNTGVVLSHTDIGTRPYNISITRGDRSHTHTLSQTPSTGLRHPEGAGKRCSECDAIKPRSHKLVFGTCTIYKTSQSPTQPLIFGTYMIYQNSHSRQHNPWSSGHTLSKDLTRRTTRTLFFWHKHCSKTTQDQQHQRWSVTHTLKGPNKISNTNVGLSHIP